MAPDDGTLTLVRPPATTDPDSDLDFTLDVRPIEAVLPIAELMRSTDDGCGSTCSGSACTSFTDDPS
jgi:FxLD family lantipeptide